jgi:hypothetical protein
MRIQKADRTRIYAVAAMAQCDHRIAKRALEHGIETIRILALRDAVSKAIAATDPDAKEHDH